MGALSQSFGTAQQAATSSLQWGAAATGLKAVGDITSGSGQAQQFNYQAQVATNNAAITRGNEASTLTAGAYEESADKLKTGLFLSQQKAAQASSGIDIGVGSPAAVRQSTATIGALDAAMIHFNSSRAAYGLESQAVNFEDQAAADRKAASNAKSAGFAKAFDSILSGATALSSKYSQFKLSGAA